MRRFCLLLFSCLVLVAPMAPAQAITSGVPDNNRHPYVGEMLFYDPDDADPRFADPGGWFTCTGTLVDSTHVVTAGHCTHATGLNGHSTTAGGGSGSGGNDVWISFAEVPNFDVLPASSTFTSNAARYAAWSAALNSSPEWVRATSFPHPEFDPNNFVLHDMGVLTLHEPVTMSTYGALPSQGLIDQLYRADKNATYTAVGYGLEESSKTKSIGGDNRRDAHGQAQQHPGRVRLRQGHPGRVVVQQRQAAQGRHLLRRLRRSDVPDGRRELEQRQRRAHGHVVRHRRELRGRRRWLPARPARRPEASWPASASHPDVRLASG